MSTLILSIIFLLSVFVVVQFYLQQEVQGQSAALQRLNSQIAGLAEQLSMAKSDKADLESQLAGLQASLAGAQSDRDKFQALYRGAAADAAAAKDKVTDLSGQLSGAQSDRDKYQALYQGAAADRPRRRKANALSGELRAKKSLSEGAGPGRDAQRATRGAPPTTRRAQHRARRLREKRHAIAAANHRSRPAVQRRAGKRRQELSGYRSDFFGKLRAILGNRPDMRIVGDRFVLQSEVFFDTSRADLKPEGRAELDKVAGAIVELESQIPPDIAWVLRVDGHTDVRPISGGQFKSNWDLSAARAIAVVQYLIDKGVKPDRLVAAAFGQYDPIDTGTTEDAYRRNRRIEFKLTEQ